jgi:hypothetical protein
MNIGFNNILTISKNLRSFGFSMMYKIKRTTTPCIDYCVVSFIGDYTVYHQSTLPILVTARSEASVCDR